MMRNHEDIHAYLERSGKPYSEIASNTWIVKDSSDSRDSVVLRLEEDLLLFRLKVLEMDTVNADRRGDLYEALLRYNAEDMIHGAYGIAHNSLVMTASLLLENLDYNEFVGTLEDFSISLSKHFDSLSTYRAS